METDVINFSTICRLCLSTNDITPIFHKEELQRRYSTAVFITTGIKVELEDGLPQKMCMKCINFLNKILKFRKKCRNAEIELLKLKADLRHDKSDAKLTIVDETTMVTIKNVDLVKQETCHDENSNNDSKDTVSICKKFPIKESIEIVDVKHETDDEDLPLASLIGNQMSDDENKDDIEMEEHIQQNNIDNKLKKIFDIETKFIKVQHIDQSDEHSEKSHDKTENCNDSKPKPYEELVEVELNKRVMCKLCQKSLSYRSIDAHMSCRHPGADDRKVKCELCDKYILKQKINRHKLLMHRVYENSDETENCFTCGYCKLKFESKQSLLEHVVTCAHKKKRRRVSEKGREMTKCDVCSKNMQRASLKMHKAIKHSGLGPVCEHCGKMFGNKFRLNEHCRAKHDYDKFKCSYCNFQSAGALAMRNHERRHRGEKPFVCETCGAKFHAAYLLAQHKQSHRTEKLIKCNLCSASFKANNSLHMHKITCHSKCLFKCFLCDRMYSCRHYVVKHLRHFHDFKEKVGPLEKVYEVRNMAEDTKVCEE